MTNILQTKKMKERCLVTTRKRSCFPVFSDRNHVFLASQFKSDASWYHILFLIVSLDTTGFNAKYSTP